MFPQGQKRILLHSSQLVVADVIQVTAGQIIPADLRIINTNDQFIIINQLMKGQKPFIRSSNRQQDNFLQSDNIALCSSRLKTGKVKGIIIAIGKQTVIGGLLNIINIQINQNQNQSKRISLKQQIQILMLRISIFTIIISIFLATFLYLSSYKSIKNTELIGGLILANIPFGIYILQIVFNFRYAKNLALLKIQCQDVSKMIKLGMTTCLIIKDAQMMKQAKISTFLMHFNGSNNINFIDGTYDDQSNVRQELKDLYHCVMLTESSESSIVKHFEKASDFNKIKEKYPIIRDSNERQLKSTYPNEDIQISVHQYLAQDSQLCIFVKGNPINIWRLCTHVMVDNNTAQIGIEQSKSFEEEYKRLIERGNKIIAFAKYHLPKIIYNKYTQLSITMIQSELNSLTFIGAIALQTQPNQSLIKLSQKCKNAGIRLIIMTDLQYETAQFLARQNRIITRQYTANQLSETKKRTLEDCIDRTNSVILTEQLLSKQNKITSYPPFLDQKERLLIIQNDFNPSIQQSVNENNHHHTNSKSTTNNLINNSLTKYLSKPQIVTANINILQQYLIIKALKSMGQNVTFLSSREQDCQLMRTADVGICKNTLQSIKNLADIKIFTSDDLTVIMNAIEEGRRILENFKKSICFILSSNIPLMMPFILSVFLPLPVHGSFLLFIAIISNTLLGAALLFQKSEIDLMTRQPNTKAYKLYGLGMIFHSYGYIGWIQFFGALLTFFVVANDFGFPPITLLSIGGNYNFIKGIDNSSSFIDWGYSAYRLNQFSCQNDFHPLDWSSIGDLGIDLRLSFFDCSMVNNRSFYSSSFQFGACNVQQISPITNKPVCYTAEGIVYAQSAYFYAVLICQFFNFLSSKTLRQPFYSQEFTKITLSCMTFFLFFFLLIGYCQPFNIAFGTRDNIFMHYGTPVIPFAILQFLIVEIKKCLIHNLDPDKKKGIPHWFVRSGTW